MAVIRILNVKEDDEITDTLDRKGYEWVVEDKNDWS